MTVYFVFFDSLGLIVGTVIYVKWGAVVVVIVAVSSVVLKCQKGIKCQSF